MCAASHGEAFSSSGETPNSEEVDRFQKIGVRFAPLSASAANQRSSDWTAFPTTVSTASKSISERLVIKDHNFAQPASAADDG